MTCQFVWWPDLEKCTNLDYFKSFGEIFHVNRSTWSLDNFSFSFSFWEPNSSLLSFVSRVFEEQKPPNIINQEWSGKGSKIRSIRFFFFAAGWKRWKTSIGSDLKMIFIIIILTGSFLWIIIIKESFLQKRVLDL